MVKPSITSSLFGAPAIVMITWAWKAVGRTGSPNGAPSSNVYRPASPSRCQYGSVRVALAGTATVGSHRAT